jgi:hypothetical protein
VSDPSLLLHVQTTASLHCPMAAPVHQTAAWDLYDGVRAIGGDFSRGVSLSVLPWHTCPNRVRSDVHRVA